MKKQYKHIIALAVIIIPFYSVAILQKILFTQEQIIVEEFLGFYMLLGIIGISTVLLSNKFILKEKLTVFRNVKSTFITDFALSGVILSSFYLLQSIEAISYGTWFNKTVESPAAQELFAKIFDNTLYSFVIIGPFNWFNEGFTAISIGFILINFWSIGNKKAWVWISIVITSSIFAVIQINLGIPEMINSFLIISISSYLFYKYRSILPLLFASILHQTIDLASYWYYF